MLNPHILLLSFPGQGHINPTLQFAKRLAALGVKVTFATTIGADRRMPKTGIPNSLSFATFSDGNDEGFKPLTSLNNYMFELRLHGTETLRLLIKEATNNGNPFTCIVYSILIPWAAKVAREFHLPSRLLWSQPATVLGIYYHYFNGYSEEITKCLNDPKYLVKLPGLPLLSGPDLPSFFNPKNSNEYAFALPSVKEQLEILEEEVKIDPKLVLLVNTFDALEFEALKSIVKFKVIGIGPLIPLAFLGKDSSDSSFGGDIFQESNKDSYIEWLNSKPKSSVIYISFGSIAVMSSPQIDEMARALIKTGHPFLWVIRENLTCMEDFKEQGLILPWCSQLEVLSHSSIGCFITHCGWNSTSESLACGVPVVGFPQWSDQMTNVKLVQDFWKTGVRVVPNEDGVVEAEEIRRCLELVMGDEDQGKEMRQNAQKWKSLAREAVMEGGYSDKNLKAFVDDISFRT